MRRLAVLVAALSLTACGPPPPPGQLQRSSLSRDLKPSLSSADRKTLVDGNTDFGLTLLRAEGSGNLVCAPYSISVTMAMVHAGARGETRTQMEQALHFDLPADRLDPGFDWLDLHLGADDRLRIANALFGQKGFHFEAPYLDTLAKSYGTGMYLLDFEKQAETARSKINDWASAVTSGRIPEALPKGSVDAATRLVLVNAVYLDVPWRTPFDPKKTTSAPFHLASGTTVDVPTMHVEGNFGYAAGTGWQLVALPYDGSKLEMDVLVPDAGTLASLTASLDGKTLDTMVQGLGDTDLAVALPKFQMRSKLDLGHTLAGLGMPDAFDPSLADLSGMDGHRDLHLQTVLHQAFVKVDEKGTVAAAVTIAGAGATSVQVPVTVDVDRPFLFFIRDEATGTVLFVGRVVDPR